MFATITLLCMLAICALSTASAKVNHPIDNGILIINPAFYLLSKEFAMKASLLELNKMGQLCEAMEFANTREIPFLGKASYYESKSQMLDYLPNMSEPWREWVGRSICDIIFISELMHKDGHNLITVSTPDISFTMTKTEVVAIFTSGSNWLPAIRGAFLSDERVYLDEFVYACMSKFDQLEQMRQDALNSENTFISDSVDHYLNNFYADLTKAWVGSPFKFDHDTLKLLKCPTSVSLLSDNHSASLPAGTEMALSA